MRNGAQEAQEDILLWLALGGLGLIFFGVCVLAWILD